MQGIGKYNFWVGLTIAIFLLCLTLLGAYYFIINFEKSDPSIKASMIGLAGVLIAAIITHAQTKKREIRAHHFSEKRQAYLVIVDVLIELLTNHKNGKKTSETKLTNRIIEFKKALLIWGSPEVIKAWNNFEVTSSDTKEPHAAINSLENILRLIRKDLGHDDSNLEFGQLWGLLLVASDKNIFKEN